MQVYCAGATEVIDTVIQAFVLGETLLLPCMVVFDGFYISHTYEAVEVPDLEAVRRFVGPPAFPAQVRPGAPANLHGLTTGENQLLLARKRHEAMLRALSLLDEINQRFEAYFGRRHEVIEVVDGATWKMTQPLEEGAKKAPLSDYLACQRRFKEMDELRIAALQEEVDRDWEDLLARVENGAKNKF